MKKSLSLSLVLLLLTSAVSNADIMGKKDTITKRFDVKAGGTLTIDSDLGSIAIKTHTGNGVDCEISKTVKTLSQDEADEILRKLSIDMTARGADVRIDTDADDLSHHERNKLVLEYIITVPETYNVDLKTGGGSISVNDLTGTVTAKTSGGSLHFGNIDGTVDGVTSGGSITLKSSTGNADLDTSGGSISIGDVHGDVNATTSGGSIKIASVYGHVEANTSGGSIHVDEVKGYINASTSGGSVTATITGQPENDCRLTTSGGGIHVSLNRNVNLNLDAKSSGGGVNTRLPLTISGTIKKDELNARLNDGGPLLFLRTSGGGITIAEQ